MKLAVFTIALNGMPFIPTIFFNLQATKLDWRWIVAEGASANTHCTSWCQKQQPGLSEDGTSQFLDMLSTHPRVTVLRKEWWDGKLAMCNACVDQIKEPCVLMQMDADELWRPDAIENVVHLFTIYPKVNHLYFWCDYFLGPNVISTSKNGYGNRADFEWLRAWRFTPGQKFISHEPPNLDGNKGLSLPRDETLASGIKFQHYAWWSENQAGFKEVFYGYENALLAWRGLQENTEWPIKSLKDFLPWVGQGALADKIYPTAENDTSKG